MRRVQPHKTLKSTTVWCRLVQLEVRRQPEAIIEGWEVSRAMSMTYNSSITWHMRTTNKIHIIIHINTRWQRLLSTSAGQVILFPPSSLRIPYITPPLCLMRTHSMSLEWWTIFRWFFIIVFSLFIIALILVLSLYKCNISKIFRKYVVLPLMRFKITTTFYIRLVITRYYYITPLVKDKKKCHLLYFKYFRMPII